MPGFGTWTPKRLAPRAWYDAHLGGSALGIEDVSGNFMPPVTNGTGLNTAKFIPYVRPGVYLPGDIANRLANSYTEGVATNIASWEAAVKVSLDQLSTGTNYLAGSGATHFTFVLTSSNRLLIRMLDVGLTLQIGDASSTNPVPGIAAGVPIWLRGKVTTSSALCEYWYSFDDTDDATQVQWISMGSVVGSNAGANVYLPQTGIATYGAYSAGLAGAAGIYYGGQQIQNDGTVNRISRWRASAMGQSGGTADAGGAITVYRPATGRKAVVLTPLANSTRSIFLLGTDDWLNVPAAAIPALDTYQAPSSVVAVFRRWHNPGATHGLPIFTTKNSANAITVGFAFRMNTTAGDLRIGSQVGDGTVNDGYESGGNVTVPLGTRAVLSAAVGNVSPFVWAVVNSVVPGTDTARATTTTTSSGGAGRVGAFLGGTPVSDLEFEALLTFDRALTETEHAMLVSYYRGGL